MKYIGYEVVERHEDDDFMTLPDIILFLHNKFIHDTTYSSKLLFGI